MEHGLLVQINREELVLPWSLEDGIQTQDFTAPSQKMVQGMDLENQNELLFQLLYHGQLGTTR